MLEQERCALESQLVSVLDEAREAEQRRLKRLNEHKVRLKRIAKSMEDEMKIMQEKMNAIAKLGSLEKFSKPRINVSILEKRERQEENGLESNK